MIVSGFPNPRSLSPSLAFLLFLKGGSNTSGYVAPSSMIARSQSGLYTFKQQFRLFVGQSTQEVSYALEAPSEMHGITGSPRIAVDREDSTSIKGSMHFPMDPRKYFSGLHPSYQRLGISGKKLVAGCQSTALLQHNSMSDVRVELVASNYSATHHVFMVHFSHQLLSGKFGFSQGSFGAGTSLPQCFVLTASCPPIVACKERSQNISASEQ